MYGLTLLCDILPRPVGSWSSDDLYSTINNSLEMQFWQLAVERGFFLLFFIFIFVLVGRASNCIFVTMLKVWSTILFFCVGLVAASAEEKTLFQALFSNNSYVPDVRPRINANETVEITIEFVVNQIKELNERSQTLYTVGFIESEWDDDYLKWKPENYSGLQEFVIPPKKVWLPDFGIQNSAETFYQDDFFEYFRVHVNHTGRVTWAFGGVFETSCEIDTVLFPFDRQRCHIVLENWAYTNESVLLVNGSAGVKLQTYHSNGIWDLVHSNVELDGISYGMHDNETYSQIKFVLHLQRKPRYYLVNIVIPCTFLTSIALLVFWLPPEAGEKVSLGVTVLLSFSVFQLIIAGSTPENSDSTPVLSTFVTLTMALSTVSVLTTVIVLHLHHKEPYHQVPKWLQVVALKILARVMCMSLAKRSRAPSSRIQYAYEMEDKARSNSSASPRHKPRGEVEKEVEEQEGEGDFIGKLGPAVEVFRSLSRQVEDVTLELRRLALRVQEREREKEVLEEWQAVAKVLDRLFFWVVVVVLVASCAWLMTMSLRTRNDVHV